jgi:acyl carrier protein
MVPGAFVLLEAMPITPNGKVDRRALMRLKAVRERETAGHVAPETALEQAIAAVWREVLQLEKVSVEDNFFDLGGHSLLLIRLHGRLQEVLARELSVVDLFTYSNIRALAAHLAHREEPPAALAETRNRAQKQIEAGRRQKDLAKARRGKS